MSQDTIEGYVDHIIFRNEDNGYTVLNLIVKGSEVTCVGTFEYVGEGDLLELHGFYVEHATYGQQFKMESYETKLPEDSIAMERYLGSGAIKGVGAALAARIVRKFKDDTLRIIDEEPERLAEVKGISEKKAREIAEQVADQKWSVLYADVGSSGRPCVSAGTNTSGKGFGASWSGATAYGKTYYGSCH